MINQTKTQLYDVFKSFDKDGSGTVEASELIEISKQMNEEITEDEVQKLMHSIDSNKDGKIQFEEFWTWWQFGKNQKLEKLVFLQLKLMNMLKHINTEFTRFGVSLHEQFDPNLDHHYWAINYGDFQPHFRIFAKLQYKGSGIKEEVQQLFQQEQKEGIQLIFMLKAVKPQIACQKLEQLWNDFKIALKNKSEKYPMLSTIVLDSIQLTFKETKDQVIIVADVVHQLIEMIMSTTYLPYCEEFGKDLELLFEFTFGIKNGLTKMMKKNQIFIKYLLEGFISVFKAEFNSDLAKKIFSLLIGRLGENISQHIAGKKGISFHNQLILPMLFKSSKFHWQFKNMEDVDEFLKCMGLEELAKDQPSARDLILEQADDEIIQNIMKENKLPHFIFQLYQILSENCFANGSINLIIPNAILSINFTLEGLKDVFDVLFRQDAESKQQKKK